MSLGNDGRGRSIKNYSPMNMPQNLPKVNAGNGERERFSLSENNNAGIIKKIQNEAMSKQLDLENRQETDHDSMKKQVE